MSSGITALLELLLHPFRVGTSIARPTLEVPPVVVSTPAADELPTPANHPAARLRAEDRLCYPRLRHTKDQPLQAESDPSR